MAIEAVVRRHYQEAEDAAGRALALDPRSARARAVLGMVRLQQAAVQDPVDWRVLRRGECELEIARQLAPDDAFVGWMRAVFLAESGHMSAAAAAAEEALDRTEHAPQSERAALLGIAGAYRYELGEERAALPHLQTYVGIRPDDSAAHFQLGACLLRLAEVPQGIAPNSFEVARRNALSAAKAFARCFELAPGDEDAALAVAAAWLRAAELAEQLDDKPARDVQRNAAVELLRRLAERFPGSAEAHYRLGVVATVQDQPEAARAAYVAALARDRDHTGSLMNLAVMMSASGDAETAKSLLSHLLAVDGVRRELSREERQRIERWLAADR